VDALQSSDGAHSHPHYISRRRTVKVALIDGTRRARKKAIDVVKLKF
jgi:hypothetical protein